jgi:hypothetical protein
MWEMYGDALPSVRQADTIRPSTVVRSHRKVTTASASSKVLLPQGRSRGSPRASTHGPSRILYLAKQLAACHTS